MAEVKTESRHYKVSTRGGKFFFVFTGHQAKTALTLWANPPMNHRVSVESVTEHVTTSAIELVGVPVDPFWG
jgi:hypothetical protein